MTRTLEDRLPKMVSEKIVLRVRGIVHATAYGLPITILRGAPISLTRHIDPPITDEHFCHSSFSFDGNLTRILVDRSGFAMGHSHKISSGEGEFRLLQSLRKKR